MKVVFEQDQGFREGVLQVRQGGGSRYARTSKVGAQVGFYYGGHV